MDIPLLLSGLNEAASFGDPAKVLYDENLSVPEITSAADIDTLVDLELKIQAQTAKFNMPYVEIAVMAIHAKVIKPFISQTDDEDDFI